MNIISLFRTWLYLALIVAMEHDGCHILRDNISLYRQNNDANLLNND